MKTERNGYLTSKRVSPFGVLPKRLVKPFQQKDPIAISKAKEWIDRNGIKILFTQKRAKGWEDVWVTDEGEILLNDPDYPPTEEEIENRLSKINAPSEIVGGTAEEKLLFLREHEKPL